MQLFRSSDLAAPGKSKLFAELGSHKNAEIQSAANRLIELLKMPVESLPALLPEAESIMLEDNIVKHPLMKNQTNEN